MVNPSEYIVVTPEDSTQGVIASFVAAREQALRERRARQVEDALNALAELKARNEANPTDKRTKMIKSLEERYRRNGILR